MIRCSICTGEQTAGFKDNETGVFHEERLIRGEEDLEQFKAQYHLQDIRKEY
ncbi:MAG: aspartate dehydrogenase [Lachnospiraceae bacterium]|nr:aspartate dehydrogenase [Lachnospiraceae bacterium]